MASTLFGLGRNSFPEKNVPEKWYFALAEPAFAQLQAEVFCMQAAKCSLEILVMLKFCFAVHEDIVDIGHDSWAVFQCLVNRPLESGSGILQAQRELDVLPGSQRCHHQSQRTAFRGQRDVMVRFHEVQRREEFGPPHHLKNLRWRWHVEPHRNDELIEMRQVSHVQDRSI